MVAHVSQGRERGMSQAAGTTEQGPPPLLTVAEAAQELRMGYRGTLAAIRRGQLLGVRIGKQYRIPRESVDALVTPPGRRETL